MKRDSEVRAGLRAVTVVLVGWCCVLASGACLADNGYFDLYYEGKHMGRKYEWKDRRIWLEFVSCSEDEEFWDKVKLTREWKPGPVKWKFVREGCRRSVENPQGCVRSPKGEINASRKERVATLGDRFVARLQGAIDARETTFYNMQFNIREGQLTVEIDNEEVFSVGGDENGEEAFWLEEGGHDVNVVFAHWGGKYKAALDLSFCRD